MVPVQPGKSSGRPQVHAPTSHQAADFDRMSIEERGVPEPALMENAGRQTALIVQHLFPDGPVAALVGSGNNGGDALVCLRCLAAWGRSVTAVLVGSRPPVDSVLHGWELPTVRFGPDGADAGEAAAADPAGAAASRVLREAAVVVDGLLGTGIRGAPRSRYAAAIEAANGAGGVTVALDAPSGVDGATGAVPGAVVRADVTVAFGWPKLGTLLHPGRMHCGRIVAVEIAFPPAPGADWAELVTAGSAARWQPRRPPVTHKKAVGAVTILAGSAMPGAAVLAARSAFRCGAGLVRVCASGDARDLLLELPETLFVDAADETALREAVQAADALAAGPGMGTGDAASRQLSVALRARGDRPAVLDADALTLLARAGADAPTPLSPGGADVFSPGAHGPADLLIPLSRGPADAPPRRPPIVVTPHPGEMARLLGTSVAAVQDDRIGAARSFASSRGVVTLLKGAPSLVADPNGRLLVSTTGHTSALAVAGMGDVLTGSIGAFLAQGAPPVAASGLALHVTGRAAAATGKGAAMMPSDVVEGIPAALDVEAEPVTELPFPFVTFDQAPPR